MKAKFLKNVFHSLCVNAVLLTKKKKKNEIIPAESTRTHTLIFSKTINWLTALFYLRKSDMAQYFWKDFYTRSLNLIWSLKQCEDRSPLLIVTIS